MAQACPSVVAQLRKAILNACLYPRGCQRFSEMYNKAIPHLTLKEEKELYTTFAELMEDQIFRLANGYFDDEPPFQLQDVLLSGSLSEGTLKANLQTYTLSDADLFLVLKNIEVSELEQIQGNLVMKENTPFVDLYLTDQHLITTWVDFLDTSNNDECKKMLSSMKLKKRLEMNYKSNGPFEAKPFDVDSKAVDEGPSIEVRSSLPENKGGDSCPLPFPTGFLDFVLAIKCEGWPLCAQEWSSRVRMWPTQDFVHKIIKSGFHLVCKSSPEGNFRLSFSNAEVLLIENLSDLQFKTYRAFKSFVGYYKNEWSPNVKKIFCSYHLKTIVFWYCEKSDPKDWNENSVVRHLLSLIDELIEALKQRFLPMYFMPKYNLMEKMEDGKEVAEKIAELRFRLTSISHAIISEEPDVQEWMNLFTTNMCPGIEQVFQKCTEKGSFEVEDFFSHFLDLDERVCEFWRRSAGRVPQPKYKTESEKAVTTLKEVGYRLFVKICQSCNDQLRQINHLKAHNKNEQQ